MGIVELDMGFIVKLEEVGWAGYVKNMWGQI